MYGFFQRQNPQIQNSHLKRQDFVFGTSGRISFERSIGHTFIALYFLMTTYTGTVFIFNNIILNFRDWERKGILSFCYVCSISCVKSGDQ
jgi:hypothetical protein